MSGGRLGCVAIEVVVDGDRWWLEHRSVRRVGLYPISGGMAATILRKS